MQTKTVIPNTNHPLLSYQELSLNTLYIIRSPTSWAYGKVFIKKSHGEQYLVEGYIFEQARMAEVAWNTGYQAKMFELAPPGTSVTLTQE